MMAGLCPQHILWISANDVLLAPPALAEVNYLIKHLSSLFLIFNSAPAADIRNGSRDNVMERSDCQSVHLMYKWEFLIIYAVYPGIHHAELCNKSNLHYNYFYAISVVPYISGLQVNNVSAEWIEFFAGWQVQTYLLSSIQVGHKYRSDVNYGLETWEIFPPRYFTGVLSSVFMQAVALCKDVSEQMFLQGSVLTCVLGIILLSTFS